MLIVTIANDNLISNLLCISMRLRAASRLYLVHAEIWIRRWNAYPLEIEIAHQKHNYCETRELTHGFAWAQTRCLSLGFKYILFQRLPATLVTATWTPFEQQKSASFFDNVVRVCTRAKSDFSILKNRYTTVLIRRRCRREQLFHIPVGFSLKKYLNG